MIGVCKADRGSLRGRAAVASLAVAAAAACLSLGGFASAASALPFNANVLFSPVSAAADSPTGLDVTLSIEQNESPEGLASADLKDSTVTLPAGMSLDPSAANGLEACTEEEIGLHDEEQPKCPPGSAIGTVEIDTLLLPHPDGEDTPNVSGTIYVGSQESNEPTSGKMYRIFLVASGDGVLIKLEGNVSANPVTGQLTTSFIETPELPFANLHLHFNSGPDASLATPITCGSFPASSVLTPYTSPYQPSLEIQSSIFIDSGPNGGACVSEPAARPFAPTAVTGTENPASGAYSPFTLKFSREDSEQELLNLSTTLPPGLLANIASVTQCPEPQAAAGECSAASKVGEATIAAGPGPEPFFLKDQPVYLTGPYKGGPFGLEVVAKVIAGPFNLGTVVVRQSIKINPVTAQATITSDPFPTILSGVPVRMREVDVTINRSDFTFNPTDCDPMAIGLTLGSTDGASDPMSEHYQSANCESLPFTPSFTVSTSGKTSRKEGASLDVKLNFPTTEVGGKPVSEAGPQANGTSSQANVRSVRVTLPEALPSRLSTIHDACAEQTFAENPAKCPSESDIGTAVAHTPILSALLQGPAYLVSHGGRAFPNLVIILQGEGVTIELVGNIEIVGNITTTTFTTVPDAPVESFELSLPEGKYSALAANGNLCTESLLMPTEITGQNGALVKQSTVVSVEGCSPNLAIVSHKVSKRKLTVTAYVPAAGKLTASGKHLTTTSKSAAGRGNLKLTLKANKAGKFSTKLKLEFKPTTGAMQTKSVAVKFKKKKTSKRAKKRGKDKKRSQSHGGSKKK